MLTRTTYAAVILASLIIGQATAQTSGPAIDDTRSTVVCGTSTMAVIDADEAARNTERLNPELHRQMLEQRRSARPRLLSQDVEWDFWVQDPITHTFTRRMATLVYEGTNALVWVDSADVNKSTHQPGSSMMRKLFRALDSAIVDNQIPPRDPNKGILANNIAVFGEDPPDPVWEDKTNIYLLDIKDAVQGQNIMGYFNQRDLTDENYSNRMNLLYVDSREGFSRVSTLLNTIAHEFQHLIHFGRHPDADRSDIVFNEGCSEVASILNGYWDRSNTGFLMNTNVDFFGFRVGEMALLADYERAMTFVHFLKEHYGEQFLYNLVGMQGERMERLDDALASVGAGTDHIGVLKAFAVANQLRKVQPGGYQFLLNSNVAPKPHVAVNGAPEGNVETATLQPYGTLYAQYRGPGGMLIQFSGPSDVHVVMMAAKSGQYDIVGLDMNTEYRLPLWEGARNDTVTFALVNGSPAIRELSWVARPTTAGADGEHGATGSLSIAGIQRGAVTYTATSALPVRVELYDLRGSRIASHVVSTPSIGANVVALPIQELANGGYVVRLTQGERTVSRLFTQTD